MDLHWRTDAADCTAWCMGETTKNKGLESATAPAPVNSAASASKGEAATVVYTVPEAVYITPNVECYHARTCKNVDLNTAKLFVSGNCCVKIRNGE